MTVKIITVHPSGAAYFYHANGGEHFFVARVRQSATTNFAYCHLCDSLTGYPRANGDAEARSLERAIRAGLIVAVPIGGAAPDPLALGHEDAAQPQAVARPLIPALIPQDPAERRTLRATLRAAHAQYRPNNGDPAS